MTPLEDMLESAKAVRQSTDVLLAGYKHGAAIRKFDFQISDMEADALFRMRCHYCRYQPEHKFNGIDQVDNKKGYVSGNVVTCCSWCNRAKGRYPLAEFLRWLQWVESGAALTADEIVTPAAFEWGDTPPPIQDFPSPVAKVPIEQLLGLSPREYVRQRVWNDAPILAPAPAPKKRERILRAHDFEGERRISKLDRKTRSAHA